MNINNRSSINLTLGGALIVLFSLLFFASQANELLKQFVIAPGSAADMNYAADCRADELEEEGLSLAECELMVSSVQISLASSPSWFRSFQLLGTSLACIAAVFSFLVGFRMLGSGILPISMARFSFSALVIVDISQFLAALNTGPLLRAQYLWPLLIWIAIHLCFLISIFAASSELEND